MIITTPKIKQQIEHAWIEAAKTDPLLAATLAYYFPQAQKPEGNHKGRQRKGPENGSQGLS